MYHENLGTAESKLHRSYPFCQHRRRAPQVSSGLAPAPGFFALKRNLIAFRGSRETGYERWASSPSIRRLLKMPEIGQGDYCSETAVSAVRAAASYRRKRSFEFLDVSR
jgi:hypothetical protein